MSSDRPQRLPSLDGLRAIAILLVVIGHSSGSVGAPEAYRAFASWLPSGHVGVELFFVISGAIITFLLCREQERRGSVSLLDFYYRRAFRILPAMGCYLAFVAVAQAFGAVHLSALDWVSSLAFLRNFIAGDWITGHLWSLSVEEQFYVFWPLSFTLLAMAGRYRFALLLALSAPVARGLLIATGHRGFATNALFSNLDFLMLGALIGLSAPRDGVVPARHEKLALRARPWLLVGFVAVMALDRHVESVLVETLAPTLRGLLFAGFVVSTVGVRQGLIFKLLNLRPLMWLGAMSYSIYLWQQAFFVKPGYYASPTALTTFGWNLVVVMALAYGSFNFIEQPALRYGARKHAAWRAWFKSFSRAEDVANLPAD